MKIQRFALAAALSLATATFATAETPARMDAEAAAPPARLLPEQAELVTETVRSRYVNGKLKSERQVARTLAHNYVNHGDFRQWDKNGDIMARGQFDAGKRTGRWMRTHQEGDSQLFKTEPFNKFTPPFTSTVDFHDGQMHGVWTIIDAEDRLVSEIRLAHGIRHGDLVYYYPHGGEARRIEFRHGQINGYDRTFDEEGEATSSHQYIAGQRHELRAETHLSTKKLTKQCYYLHPRSKIAAADDWWNAQLASFTQEAGEPVRHGEFTGWHINGHRAVVGEYDQGRPVGEFTWWYYNGQIALRGGYDAGQPDGEWHWWHTNGMKKAEGTYASGKAVGRWMTWDDEGQLARDTQHTPPSDDRTATRPSDERN